MTVRSPRGGRHGRVVAIGTGCSSSHAVLYNGRRAAAPEPAPIDIVRGRRVSFLLLLLAVPQNLGIFGTTAVEERDRVDGRCAVSGADYLSGGCGVVLDLNVLVRSCDLVLIVVIDQQFRVIRISGKVSEQVELNTNQTSTASTTGYGRREEVTLSG